MDLYLKADKICRNHLFHTYNEMIWKQKLTVSDLTREILYQVNYFFINWLAALQMAHSEIYFVSQNAPRVCKFAYFCNVYRDYSDLEYKWNLIQVCFVGQ